MNGGRARRLAVAPAAEILEQQGARRESQDQLDQRADAERVDHGADPDTCDYLDKFGVGVGVEERFALQQALTAVELFVDLCDEGGQGPAAELTRLLPEPVLAQLLRVLYGPLTVRDDGSVGVPAVWQPLLAAHP